MEKLLAEAREMICSVKHKYLDQFIFIHINRTGGSSVERALMLPYRRKHWTALEKIEQVGRDNWDRKLTFTTVRNPWDKVVSEYHFRMKTNQNNLLENPIEFNKWVKYTYQDKNTTYYDKRSRMFLSQIDWISDQNGFILVDEILHFENLHNDFNSLMRKLGKNITLPHVNSTDHRNYQEYYTPETKQIVQIWFEQDIERFGYSFE